ncbi:hypothetical protein E2C01_020290 [Portunus trituberculatus]|uniref:Uncharacterized protein n=1 Tax=Portunus trituberculatus TaxID=210409 RepID=A0A5B7E148_PORTR|nr:hypothetical protein [Portunus trituberculatus]
MGAQGLHVTDNSKTRILKRFQLPSRRASLAAGIARFSCVLLPVDAVESSLSYHWGLGNTREDTDTHCRLRKLCWDAEELENAGQSVLQAR